MATQSSFGVEASPDSVRSRHVDGELPEARVLLPSRTEEFDLEAEAKEVCATFLGSLSVISVSVSFVLPPAPHDAIHK